MLFSAKSIFQTRRMNRFCSLRPFLAEFVELNLDHLYPQAHHSQIDSLMLQLQNSLEQLQISVASHWDNQNIIKVWRISHQILMDNK